MSTPYIVVVEYNPDWPNQFEVYKTAFQNYLGELLLDIQHIGSTSVPNLAAKPILDIDLIVKDEITSNKAVEMLAQLGYEHLGDLGITGREAFKKLSDKTPDFGTGVVQPKHNLYVCVDDCISLRNHLALRDYLRTHPGKVQEYGALKKALAKQFPDDIDQYVEGKTPFITGILAALGFGQDDVSNITEANKARS